MPKRSQNFEYVLQGDRSLPEKDQARFLLLMVSADMENELRRQEFELSFSQAALIAGDESQNTGRDKQGKKKAPKTNLERAAAIQKAYKEIENAFKERIGQNHSLLKEVLIGWKNFKVGGKSVAFNIDNAFKNLTNEEIAELFRVSRGLTEAEVKNSN